MGDEQARTAPAEGVVGSGVGSSVDDVGLYAVDLHEVTERVPRVDDGILEQASEQTGEWGFDDALVCFEGFRVPTNGLVLAD